jgi:hypothetical protein
MAGAPHVHTDRDGDHDCPACVARTIDAARSETPELTPLRVLFPAVVVDPVAVVPVGYPLGAVSGQSPPLSA